MVAGDADEGSILVEVNTVEDTDSCSISTRWDLQLLAKAVLLQLPRAAARQGVSPSSLEGLGLPQFSCSGEDEQPLPWEQRARVSGAARLP